MKPQQIKNEVEKDICTCGHHKNYHIDREPFLSGCSFIIDNHYCYCNEFKELSKIGDNSEVGK